MVKRDCPTMSLNYDNYTVESKCLSVVFVTIVTFTVLSAYHLYGTSLNETKNRLNKYRSSLLINQGTYVWGDNYATLFSCPAALICGSMTILDII